MTRIRLVIIYDDDGLIKNAGDISIIRDALNGLITNVDIGNITGTRGYNAFGEPSSYTAAFEGMPIFIPQPMNMTSLEGSNRKLRPLKV